MVQNVWTFGNDVITNQISNNLYNKFFLFFDTTLTLIPFYKPKNFLGCFQTLYIYIIKWDEFKVFESKFDISQVLQPLKDLVPKN
jgi:hypothetical protein